jgi:hypothetical protein
MRIDQKFRWDWDLVQRIADILDRTLRRSQKIVDVDSGFVRRFKDLSIGLLPGAVGNRRVPDR